MVTLGYEDPVMMPTMLIYNTDLMKAYIAGVKEQYDNARQDVLDFMKLYQDFRSPIEGDTEAYYNMTVGGANDMLNDMMSNGINPFKSPEAQAAISRYIYTRPVGLLNEIKQKAESYNKYKENLADALMKGTANQDYENWRLYLMGLLDKRVDPITGATTYVPYSTIDPETGKVRQWNVEGPEKYTGLLGTVKPVVESIEDTILPGDGKYNYTGVSEDMVKGVLGNTLAGYMQTPEGRYQLELEKQKLRQLGNPNPTDEDAAASMAEAAYDMTKGRVHKKKDADPYALDNARTNNDIRAAREKANIDYDLFVKQNNYYASHGGDPKKGGSGSSNTKGSLEAGEYDPYLLSSDAQYDYNKNAATKTKSNGSKTMKIPVKGKDGKYHTKSAILVPYKRNGITTMEWLIEDDNAKHTVNGKTVSIKGSNGKTYRRVTDEEMQRSALHGSTKETYIDKVAIEYGYEFVQNIDKILGQTTDAGTRFFTRDFVAHHVDGVSVNRNSYKNDKDAQEEIRKKLNVNDYSGIRFHTTGEDIILSGGKRKAKYINATYTANGVEHEMLFKLGEYERSSDGSWVPTSGWITIMANEDKQLSVAIAGQKESVDITNK